MADVGVGFVDIIPRTDQFTKLLTQQVQKALDPVKKQISDALGKLSLGQLAAVGGAAAGIGLVTKAITDGVKATTEWAAEVRSLQRVTGQTAESASALAAAGNTLGISSQQLTVGFGLLAKNIVNASANLTKYGIATQDVQGNVLPFDEVLSNVIDKFQTLPAGPEQAAFAMNVFGRSGKALIPILQRGQQGLADLEDAAKSAGLVLSQNDVDAAKSLTIAQRQLGEAFKGASISIGRLFVPLITPVVQGFREMVDGAIQLGTTIGHTLAPFIAQVGDAFQRLMTALSPLMPLLSEIGKLLGSAGLALAIVPLIALLKGLVITFNLVTDAVNLMIAGLNVLISGLNSVIDISNSLLHTHFEHIDALQQVATATTDTAGATTGYTDALGPATDATKKMSAAQTALRSAVSSAGDGLLSLSTNVKNTFDVSKKEMEKGFADMLAVALRFKADAEKLSTLKLGLDKQGTSEFIAFLSTEGPGAIDRFVNSSAADQKRFVEEWQQGFKAIAAGKKDLENPVTMHVSTAAAQADIARFINNIPKDVFVTVHRGVDSGKTGGVGGGATGGLVTSTGIRRFATGGSTDTVPAMLSPGEFVLRRSAVERIGLDALRQMNGGGMVGGGRPGKTKMDGALRIYDWRNGLATLDSELSWEDTVRTR